ncbi:hypothetical protein PtrM4_079260 [Pyrenophora tritici-repentis]|uniref:RNA-directed DNA polymerase n=1 Tax=Pyrenophora tritici-repentis TaxID=45151 RepID=A0A834VQC6_9PLEO|nr:hypothetical protein PtrM4_079260 [Pyrenophora tritici-repentis]
MTEVHFVSSASIGGKPSKDFSRQLEFPGSALTRPDCWQPISTLIDTGASACFVNQSWVNQHRLDTMPVAKPIRLSLANGGEVDKLTQAVDLPVRHGSHTHNVLCYVTNIGKYDVILGMNWMDYHQPALHFGDQRSLTFAKAGCKLNCLHEGLPETVYENGVCHSHVQLVKGDYQTGDTTTKTNKDGKVTTEETMADIYLISAAAATALAAKHPDQVIWLEPRHWAKLAKPPDEDREGIGVAAVSQTDFEKYMHKMEQPYMTRDQIGQLVPEWVLDELPDLFNPHLAHQLPERRPGVDHPIDLLPDTTPPKPHVYGLTRTETEAVKKYIDDMLQKGLIKASNSPFASPVLIVKKPGGGLRICVDYRALNNVTKKNRNAPPAIKETLARMAKVQIMSLVDVVAAFNTVRIKEGDEEKTAFLTRYGLYEYMVMPFGLCNAPGTFQNFINETLREYLDVICTAYLDDILIYSDNEKDHRSHVLKVLRKIQGAGLSLDPTKCKFETKRVKYLGLILTTDGIEMDPEKVSTVLDWQLPRSVKDMQSFLGFCNFYRRFIKGFSYIAKPLTELTKEGSQRHFPLQANGQAAKAFEQLKLAFKTAGVLSHFDPDLETWLETDASDFVTAAILSQMHKGVLRPVAFLSHKMTPAECNYEIYDKELLAIVRAFEEWRFELSGTDDPILVLSDHQALQTFMTTKRLNRRQARWAEFLAEFNFRVKYRPGKQGTKPDALTRRPGDLPANAEDERRQHQVQVILKPDQVDPECRVATFSFHFDGGSRHAVYLANALVSLAMMMYQDSETDDFSDEYLFALGDTAEVDDTSAAPLTEPDTSLDEANILQTVRQAYPDDDIVQVILKAKADGQRRIPYHLIHGPNRIRLELGDCSIHDGVFYVKKKVYIPESGTLRTRIIERVHRSYCGGHSGKHGSYDMLNRWYYWPKMINDVAQYVKNCLACRRSKSYRDGKHGLLHPLPIPERYWSSISMDYITHLPPCTDNGRTYTNVLVIVDRLSKKKKFIPVVDLKVDTLVKAFVEYVWREEGYPDSIVSDRGAQFLSHFWTRLCQRLGTKPKLSTGYHPETDGQTENANAWLKQYLRSYINYEQDNWALFLPMAEFEANNAINASTGTTAFRLTKGYDPKSGLEPPKVNTGLTAPARRDQDNANKFAEKLDALRKALRLELQWSQAKQAEYANDARLPAPEFKVGDQVMLDARNFRTTRPSLSLDFKNRGPFTVTRVIDNMAYELLLPPEMGKLHNVFHPWLLHLHEEAPLPGQLRDSAPAEFADPDEEDGTSYEVEAVLDSRVNKRLKDPYSRSGLLQYLVRWTNYPAGTDNPSWEPYMNLVDSADIVQQYHESRPKAPGPHRKFATLAGKQDLLMITVIASSNNPKPPPGAPTIQQTEETIGPRSFRNTGNIAV